MTTEQTDIIKQSLTEGKDRHATRRELISQGVSTQDFDTAFNGVLGELGISEPKQAMPKLNATGEAPVYFKTHRKVRVLRVVRLCVLVCILLGVAWYAFEGSGVYKIPIPSLIQDTYNSSIFVREHSDVSFADSILKTKVDATVASAQISGKRMGDYTGVCKDITVVPPVACKESEKSFAIFVPLSNGTQYCVDSTQKVSSFVDPSPNIALCK